MEEKKNKRDYRKEIGRAGEDLAELLLLQRGYRIIRRNFSCRLGEIDIIAERDGLLSFVEVKTRFSQTYGAGREAVNRQKQRHMRAAAQVFLQANAFGRVLKSKQESGIGSDLGAEVSYREVEFAVIEIHAEHLTGLAM